MTGTIWRTAAHFAADLPAMSSRSASAIRWHFADLADMHLPADMPGNTWCPSETRDCWQDSNSIRGASMAQARKMAHLGWPEGAETARRLHAGIVATMPTRRRLARYGVAGAVPSVPRALAGNPLHMRQLAMKETAQRPIVTLVCSIAVSWGFPADAMLSHASAVAAVVDLLEESEFRCEVIVVARTGNSQLGSEIAIKLKSAEQPLNLSAMAFGLGHPALWRRLMFGLLWMEPKCAPLGIGLGSPDNVPAMPEAGTYTIASASRLGGETADAPSRFRAILDSLAMQGCPGIPEQTQAA